MPKFIKYCFSVFFIIIAVLVIIPFFIPLNSYKPIISTKVKELTGRDLKINGDIKFVLLPNPTITLQEVKLSSAPGTKEAYLLELNEVKAELSLSSLIQREIKISDIVLQQPIINLEVLDNGMNNWEMFVKSNESSNEQQLPTDNDIKLPFDIENIKIVKGKLTYTKNSNAQTLDNIDFVTKISGVRGPIDFTLLLNVFDQKIEVQGNIPELDKITPINLTANVFDQKITVEGKIDLKNNSFVGTSSVKGSTKNFNVSKEWEKEYEFNTLIMANNKEIVIKDAKITVPGVIVTVNANYDLAQNNGKANFSINPGNIIITLSSNNLVSYDLKINNMESLLSILKINNSMISGPLNISGSTKKVQDVFHTQNKINVLGIDIILKGEVNLANKKPNLLLSLQTEVINLDRLLQVNATKSTNASTSKSNISHIPWSNNPVDLSFLNSIDANITAQIGKISSGSLVLNSTKAALNIKDGKLNVNSIVSNIYGGQFNASGYVSGQKDQDLSLKINLKDAYLQNIITQGSKIKVTEGRLNLQADLHSKGNSVHKYINQLVGQVNLNASNGKISGFDLTKVTDAVNNIKNVQGILGAINSSFSSGETKFSNLIANAHIANGVATFKECQVEATPAVATCMGQVNLPQYTMDVNAAVTIQNFPPFGAKLYGALDNPQHKLDIQALQGYLAKNIVNSVIKDIKSGESKPENIIKNALGLREKNADSNDSNSSKSSNENKADPVNKLLNQGLKKLFK